jgi:hypothetical protein
VKADGGDALYEEAIRSALKRDKVGLGWEDDSVASRGTSYQLIVR